MRRPRANIVAWALAMAWAVVLIPAAQPGGLVAAKRHHKHDTTSTVAVTTSEPLETTTQSLPTSSIQTSSHPVTATDIDSTTTTLQSTTTTLQSTAGASDLQTASSGLDGRQGFMDREKGGSSGPREAFRGLAAAEPIRDEAATADDEEEIGGPPTQQEGGDQEEASTGSLACTGNTAALILPHALSDLPLSRVMEAIELLREAGLLVHVDERKGIPAEDVLADLDHSMEKVDCVAVGTAGYQASHSGVGNTDYNWSDSANWPVWVNALIGVAAGACGLLLLVVGVTIAQSRKRRKQSNIRRRGLEWDVADVQWIKT